MNSIVNFAVLTLIVPVLAYAIYALWDSEQVFMEADKSHYAVYKPVMQSTYGHADSEDSFGQLQSINPDVIGWLDVYGTNIDYPVTQGSNNWTYINTNAEGQYSLSGAIFMDSENDGEFNDFNSILYGHHMDNKVMFGEIGEFIEPEVFETHRYGGVYHGGKQYGIEFFAFLHTDAYDNSIYFTRVSSAEKRRDYVQNILNKAIYKRDVDIGPNDRIILLSTCSSRSTNGRDILVGKITDGTFADPFLNIREMGEAKQPLFMGGGRGVSVLIPWWLPVLAMMLTVRLVIHIPAGLHRRKQGNRNQEQVMSI